MDPTRKNRYLDALGIERWVLRDAAAPTAAEAVVEEPAPAAEAAIPRIAAVPAAPEALSLESSVPVAKKVSKPVFEVPRDWDGLRAAVAGCMQCKLCKTRTNTVFGVGQMTSPLMVVGEGPGADEDARGEPFVGRAGKLLDEMLKAIGRSRQETDPKKAVFIANVVKCRPPGNRDPEPDEVEACRPYLDQQIHLVRPKLIVALGRVAAQRLLATDLPLAKLRGQQYEYGPDRTPVLITYHPAYLLRSPGEKAKSWQDLKRVHRFLQEHA
jgi:DNA polymerase